MYQQGFPVNELDEVVISSGFGSSNQVATLPVDMLPIKNGGVKFNGVQLLKFSEKILSKNGFVGNGTSDDSAALQMTIDEITASDKRCGLILPEYGLNVKINSGLVFDLSTMANFDFAGAIIDATGMTVGTAIRISADKDKTIVPSNTPYGNAIGSLSRFKLQGPGFNSTVKGLQFNQPSGISSSDPGPSRMGLDHFAIDGFSVGIEHFNHAYGEIITNGEVLHCGNGVIFRNNATDAGERATYVGCAIYNNTRGVIVGEGATSGGNVATWMKFIGCSLDYNQIQVLVANGAKIELIGCHVEGDPAAAYYPSQRVFQASGDGSVIKMNGGQLVYPATVNRAIDYFVDNSVPKGTGGVFFNNVDCYRIDTTTGEFSTGVGDILLNGLTTVSTNSLPLLVSLENNELCDGGFEQSTIADLIQITSDTASITSRLTGTNLTIVSSAAIGPYHSGSRALRVNKVGASATAAQFVILVPMRDTNKRGSFKGFFRKSTTGTVSIQPIYATCQPGTAAGVVSVMLKTASESAISFTDTTATWVEVKSVLANRKTPQQAGHKSPTHYGILVNMDSMPSHNLDIDDLQLQFI
jgi:hypothetical protein